jgi:hypothetical protein
VTIRYYANICKRTSEYSLECKIRLKFCEYSLQNKNIRQYEKMYLFCINCNTYLFANLCEYFEANIKQIMLINTVGNYTGRYRNMRIRYEANKIHFRFEANKKSCECYGAPSYLHGRPGACTRVRARSATALASAPFQAPALRGRSPVIAVVMLVACHWMIFFRESCVHE